MSCDINDLFFFSELVYTRIIRIELEKELQMFLVLLAMLIVWWGV